MEFVQVLGYTAGAVTSLTFLPQVVKTWKEKSVQNISLMMFVLAATCQVMWILYGVLKEDWVIILTNSVILTMSLTMIFFKFKYGKAGAAVS